MSPLTPGMDACRRAKVGLEAALEFEIDDLQVRSVNDAPVGENAELRDSADTDIVGFGDGVEASATLIFDSEHAATIHEGLAVYENEVVRDVRAYERVDPRLGHLFVRAHENPIGPIEIHYEPHTGKTKFVEDNLKMQMETYVKFQALAAKRSVEAGD